MVRPTPRVLSPRTLAALFGGTAPAFSATAGAGSVVEKGKQAAVERKDGTCAARQLMDDAQLAGNVGPALVAMKARFPDKAKPRAQIWDATEKNPTNMMPPFGRHDVLTEDGIDAVTEYVHTL